MIDKLEVVLTKTRDGIPLCYVRNFPNDADMTPSQMRALAYALEDAATECEQMPMNKKPCLYLLFKNKSYLIPPIQGEET